MKRFLFLIFFTCLSTVCALAQEMVLECTYSSNTSYKVLLVINAEGGEAMSLGNDKRCHYDLKTEIMEDHVIILAYNASLPNWVDDIYIISGDNSFVVSPSLSSDNCARIEVEQIEGASKIAAKKREYGLTGSNSYRNSKNSGGSRL